MHLLSLPIQLNTTLTSISFCGTVFVSAAHLSYLNLLADNNIRDGGTKSLAQVLRLSTTLTSLNLSGKKCLAFLIIYLCHLLQTDNYIQSQGIQYLVPALQLNTILKSLNLSGT